MTYCPHEKTLTECDEIVLTEDPQYSWVDFLGVEITVARIGDETLYKCQSCKRKFIS